MPTYASRSLWTSTPGYDSSTIAWIANVFAQSGVVVSDAQAILVNTLIVGLKADSVWDKLDRLWLFAIEDADEALNDIVVGGIATTVNAPTFTVNQGYAGDGSTSYVNTNYAPGTDGTYYTLNAAHFSVWDNTNRSAANNQITLGCRNTAEASESSLWDFFGPNQAVVRINGFTTIDGSGPNTSLGYFIVNAVDSANFNYYYNGSLQNLITSGTTVSPISDRPFFVGGANFGSLVNPTADQISAVSFGGLLNATDAANLYSRLRTYMTAVGVP